MGTWMPRSQLERRGFVSSTARGRLRLVSSLSFAPAGSRRSRSVRRGVSHHGPIRGRRSARSSFSRAFFAGGPRSSRPGGRGPRRARAGGRRVATTSGAASPLSDRHSERGPGFRRRLCATATPPAQKRPRPKPGSHAGRRRWGSKKSPRRSEGLCVVSLPKRRLRAACPFQGLPSTAVHGRWATRRPRRGVGDGSATARILEASEPRPSSQATSSSSSISSISSGSAALTSDLARIGSTSAADFVIRRPFV